VVATFDRLKASDLQFQFVGGVVPSIQTYQDIHPHQLDIWVLFPTWTWGEPHMFQIHLLGSGGMLTDHGFLLLHGYREE